MARNFRRQRTSHPIAEVNVTNLIDLGFILLVIFMIATPLMQQEETIPVQLPSLTQSPQKTANPDDRFVAIGVDATGQFYVENSRATVTMTELRSRLRAYAAEPKPPVIRVRGDAKVFWEKMAELLNEMQRAGLVRFTIDYQTDN
jgi:biopolymer transport protein ExbD